MQVRSRERAERALEWLRALGESLQAPHASKEKADVMHAIYDRITVAGPEIVGVRLTQAAYAHGLALALPEKVELARPTGFNRADAPNRCGRGTPPRGRRGSDPERGAAAQPCAGRTRTQTRSPPSCAVRSPAARKPKRS